MDQKIAHLQMLQAVIDRMANNSFHIKGWSVTLVAAFLALAAVDDINVMFVYLAYFPAFMFWSLDAYFLHQESLFRKLYDEVRGLSAQEIDFSMDTSAFVYQVDSITKVARSYTLRLFHGSLTGSIIVVMVAVMLKEHTGG